MSGLYLGIELGSTRIKAVLINERHRIIADGNHTWENRLENGLWTYPEDEIWNGVRAAYAALAARYTSVSGDKLRSVGRICVSAMMHGYLVFDKSGELLVPFRTWRNTNTAEAAAALSKLFGFNIPLRWSAAHLYQAALDGGEHVGKIDYMTTLAGYVHWKLTGERVLGVGDASGMFPLDGAAYDGDMLRKFDDLCSGSGVKIHNILPKILLAGEHAGSLTPEGARLLDPAGNLAAGIPFAPPEGDAGTGMTATNSVAPRTGNISAGTSVFAMTVLEKPLGAAYPEIDIVAAPDGKPAAMVHANNCTSDLDAWVKIFGEFTQTAGVSIEKPEIYNHFYNSALKGDADCGGLLAYNNYSGEPITGLSEGRPLFARTPEARFSFNNFARTLLYSAIAVLRIGMDVLKEKEHVRVSVLTGHGGFFKTPGAGQRLMAAALDSAVRVYDSAGEGGAWGAALLAAYASDKKPEESLGEYLSKRVFANTGSAEAVPDPEAVIGFNEFLERYTAGLEIEHAAVRRLK